MTHEPKRSGGLVSITRVFLICVMLLLGGASAYEWGYARPDVKQAFDVVVEVIEARKNAEGPPEFVSPEEVRSIMGRDPADAMQTIEANGISYCYEEYVWPAGLPGRRFNLVALYSTDEPRRLQDVQMNRSIEEILSLDVAADYGLKPLGRPLVAKETKGGAPTAKMEPPQPPSEKKPAPAKDDAKQPETKPGDGAKQPEPKTETKDSVTPDPTKKEEEKPLAPKPENPTEKGEEKGKGSTGDEQTIEKKSQPNTGDDLSIDLEPVGK